MRSATPTFTTAYARRYKFDIVDAWKNHTPKPFKNIPDTYTFLVKHPILWRMAYMSQQPRVVHKPYLWGCGSLLFKHLDDMCAASFSLSVLSAVL